MYLCFLVIPPAQLIMVASLPMYGDEHGYVLCQGLRGLRALGASVGDTGPIHRRSDAVVLATVTFAPLVVATPE